MPPINHAALASAGIIVASVAVAAAIAVYESPELRRMAEDFRRRIAIALHSLGDNIDPARREPLFNRPEDAEGFLQSRGLVGAEQGGVDADDESRRRQREELMYWNALREEKQARERRDAEKAGLSEKTPAVGTTFDDFLQQDRTAEQGTYVFNTGAQVRPDDEGLIRRRGGVEGVRGLNASVFANPFADENGIGFDEHPGMEVGKHPLSPGRDEIMSDIYSASPLPEHSDIVMQTLPPMPIPELTPEVLFDFSEAQTQMEVAPVPPPKSESKQSSVTLDRESAADEDEYMTAGQGDNRHDAYASIQAWASSNTGFYSPLPVSPLAPLSEPELISNADIISDGARTPTASIAPSVAGSAEDLGADPAVRQGGSDYGVMSEDEDGIATPNSWSEVGSVISESDGALHA